MTGKGRCNVTNDCTRDDFFNSIVSNQKFMFASFSAFNCSDTIDFFNNNNCPLKTERGNRVFPVSDKSSDILKCLEKKLTQLGVKVYLDTTVLQIKKEDDLFYVKTNHQEYVADKVIIATGGNFYKATGSTGDGYLFTQKFGHNVITPKPSLIGLKTKQKHDLAGLTLKNVSATLFCNDKKVATEFGELLFTHNGISGPIVLTLSTLYNKDNNHYKITLDLKPALTNEQLDKRLLRDFEELKNKEIKNSLSLLLPASLASYLISKVAIDPERKINSITVAERTQLLNLLKQTTFDIVDVDNPDSAIITRGGVDTKQINPKTMESKLVSGLYVCGELLDVDALTGGFNIQIAFSTGAAAGKNAVE